MSKSIKISFNEDIRRRPIPEKTTIADLVNIASELFAIPPERVAISHNGSIINSNEQIFKILTEEGTPRFTVTG